MAQIFGNAVMTDNGASLLTMAAAGQISIEFTHMAVGNGTYSDGEKAVSSLQKRAGLKSLKNKYAFSSITAYTNTCVKMTAIVSNYDSAAQKALVTTGYYINEIGIFAKAKGAVDSTAVLYSIAVVSGTQGDYMPPYNGYNPAQIVQDYLATVNATTDITINTAGAAALKDDLEALTSDVRADEVRLNGITSETMIEEAFEEVYGLSTDPTSMSISDIDKAIDTAWNGESSADGDAMSADNVEASINTTWDGESSADEDAITAAEINNITG